MVILRNKKFSVSTFSNNRQFRDDLYRLGTCKPEKTEDTDFPQDILRLFSVETKHGVKRKVSYKTNNDTQVFIIPKDEIYEQYDDDKTPTGIKKIDKKRVVLAFTGGDSEIFIISWFVNDKRNKFKVTKETAALAFITRGFNKLFGKQNLKVLYETDSLQDAFKWLDKNIVTTVICY